MVCEHKCPKCGGSIEYDECVETSYNEGQYYDTMVGHCVKCREKYIWDEVYIYSHIELFRKLAEGLVDT